MVDNNKNTKCIMKRVILFLVLVCFLSTSCYVIPRKKKIECGCCEEQILQIADGAMRLSKSEKTIYERIITEEETYFIVSYGYIDDGIVRFGGGGEIKISKETCEIIEKKFYQ